MVPGSDDSESIRPDQFNNTEFWNDLVLTYCTLTANGFRARNIFVLYGDGEDFKSETSGYRPPYCYGARKITDIPMSSPRGVVKDNICNVLCCMATGRPATQRNGECRCCDWGGQGLGGFSCRGNRIPHLRAEDFLFVWLKGHGYTSNCRTSLDFNSVAGDLSDDELATLLEELPTRARVLVLETCGGLVGQPEQRQHRPHGLLREST